MQANLAPSQTYTHTPSIRSKRASFQDPSRVTNISENPIFHLSFSAMGRGKSWEITENEALARARVSASEEPITDTNQTSKVFTEAIRRRFIEKGPSQLQVPEGRYGHRNAQSCKSHFDAISADAQKFSLSLRKVHACSSTGVTEDHIISMAIAIHLGKTERMEYNYKDFHKQKWPVYKAWKVLSTGPKWSQRCVGQEDSAQRETKLGGTEETNANTAEDDSAPDVGSGNGDNGSDDVSGQGESVGSACEERFRMVSRNAKLIRQGELRTNAARLMAGSAKRKSTALEERNAIAVFLRREAYNLLENASFFQALCETHLAQALKRVRSAREEAITMSTLSTTHELHMTQQNNGSNDPAASPNSETSST